MTSHANCAHPATKKDRAACRKANGQVRVPRGEGSSATCSGPPRVVKVREMTPEDWKEGRMKKVYDRLPRSGPAPDPADEKERFARWLRGEKDED
jgi:hypothetical protein